MFTRALLLSVVLSMALPAMSQTDDWILTPGKGSITPNTPFSDEVIKELPSRGLDWGPWIAFRALQNPDSIPTAGKHYVSPDQQFSVETAFADRELYFVIKNAKTGQTDRLASPNFPVLALAWSQDSKSLVAVVHFSMTSLLEVIHWDGSKWAPFEIDAPEGGDNDKFHVVGWQFQAGYLEAAYIVDHRAGNGASLDLYRCTFHVDPASGKVSHVTKTTISQKEFISLRNASN
jgi:hypothetical protein